MSSERWQKLDRLFAAALERPAVARPAFVTEQCGEDDVLRSDVLSLLAAADGSGEFLTAPAFERLAKAVGAQGWTFVPGEQVGAYTVVERLAAGSSGEVWRARDDRFDRDVALKVLLPHVSDDPNGIRRFADELRAVGSLNHPNILAVYDVGNHQGLPYLVSEYLSGQSLRTRLDRGALAINEILSVGIGIGRGLAAAHHRRIVHRDLKPENVFILEDGSARILDFGVAKLQRVSAPVEENPTMAGFIVGTAAYMAPEQVRGEEIDPRADLFALGAMLYEMLCGQAPFKRSSAVETLHAVLTVDPQEITGVRSSTPDDLARIVRRLLQKDRDARFQSAGDLVWALEQVSSAATETITPRRPGTGTPSSSTRRLAPLWVAAVAIAAVAAVVIWRPAPLGLIETSPKTSLTRFSWPLPAGVGLVSAPAVSPDGAAVAFVGVRDGSNRLFIRALNAIDATEIEGSAGARQPFWSPDSKWVGFFARRRLLKVSIAGGAPTTVVDDSSADVARTERGGGWGSGDVIVYGPGTNPAALFSAPAGGGPRTPVTLLMPERGDATHRFPSLLPDGEHFLYEARGTEHRGLFLGRRGGERPSAPLIEVDSNGIYVPTPGSEQGVVLYAAGSRLTAHRFDPVRRVLVGAAQPLGIEVGQGTLFHPGAFGASSQLLAYSTQLNFGSEIKTLDSSGGSPMPFMDRREQQWPRISPDGTRMAWLLIDTMQGADIWVEDLTRRTRTRITTAPERDLSHVWSPDGKRLAYRPDVEDRKRLTIIAADGSGLSEDLVCPRAACEPTDWSSDGRELIVNTSGAQDTDVWAMATADGGRTRPLLDSRFNERDARLSPDRRWLAYVSDEAGMPQVSVRSVDGSPRRYTVSPAGGDQVVWARDGRALYYVDAQGGLQKVVVRGGNGSLVLAPAVAVPVAIGSGHSNTQYDIAPNGRLFYVDATPLAPPTAIQMILGWQDLLR